MKNNFIENIQKKIIFFANKNKKRYSEQYTEKNYLNIWQLNIGNYYLRKKFLKISFFENCKLLFFLFYKKNIAENYNFYSTPANDKIFKKKYLNLIISFKSNKTDFDTHFSSNRSSSKNSLWFLINLSDQKLTEKSDNIIFSRKKKNSLNFIKFKTIILFLFWLFSPNKNHDEKLFFDTFEDALNKININTLKKIFLPYESQPYQKYIINLIKKKNPNCKVIAYCHGGLPSLPIEYFDNELVDKIYVHSKVEKNILNNFFGWKKKKIILTKSFRHYNKKKICSNNFYLPYSFNFNFRLKDDLDFISSKYNLGSIKIVSHPFSGSSKNQKKITDYFNKIKKKNNLIVKKQDNIAIFLGVTGSILEALQNKLTVIHVTNNPQFELYSNFLWKNILVKKINSRIFVYKLKEKNTLVKYSNKNYFIKKNKL
tara:strand:- start:1283 stop:2563 length:1281 start_codon:yes stop_codon:yes gene_type:complete